MTKHPSALLLGVGAILAAGCAPKGDSGAGVKAGAGGPPKTAIVGEWTGSLPDIAGGRMTVLMKFNNDGTYSETTTSGQISSLTDGTYVYSDSSKQLTMNQKRMLMGGQEVKMNGGAATMNLAPSRVTWKGHGEILYKQGLNDYDLTRK
ncbi:MAG: hypothetical protein ACYC96_16740 [Fimbriimonadaceae bacterium]